MECIIDVCIQKNLCDFYTSAEPHEHQGQQSSGQGRLMQSMCCATQSQAMPSSVQSTPADYPPPPAWELSTDTQKCSTGAGGMSEGLVEKPKVIYTLEICLAVSRLKHGFLLVTVTKSSEVRGLTKLRV